jgi:Mn-containing catalase
MTEEEPIKVASGKFALWQTPKGGMHLTLQVEGEEEPRHVEIPSMMVKMMMRKAKEDGHMPPELVEVTDE